MDKEGTYLYKDDSFDDLSVLDSFISKIHLELLKDPTHQDGVFNDSMQERGICLIRHLDEANDSGVLDPNTIISCVNELDQFFGENPVSLNLFKEDLKSLRIFINVIKKNSHPSIICPLLHLLSQIALFSNDFCSSLIDLNIKSVIERCLKNLDLHVQIFALQLIIDLASKPVGWKYLATPDISYSRIGSAKPLLNIIFEFYASLSKRSNRDNVLDSKINLLILTIFAALFNDNRKKGIQWDGISEVLDILFPKSVDNKPCLLTSLKVCAIAAKEYYPFFQSIFRTYMGLDLFLKILDFDDFEPNKLNENIESNSDKFKKLNEDIETNSEEVKNILKEEFEDKKYNPQIRCAVLATFVSLIKENFKATMELKKKGYKNHEQDSFSFVFQSKGLFDKLLNLLNHNGEEINLVLEIIKLYSKYPSLYPSLFSHPIIQKVYELLTIGTHQQKFMVSFIFSKFILSPTEDSNDEPSDFINHKIIDLIIIQRFPKLYSDIVFNLSSFSFSKPLFYIFDALEVVLQHIDMVNAREIFLKYLDVEEVKEIIQEMYDDFKDHKQEINIGIGLEINLERLIKHLNAFFYNEEYESP